MYLSENILSIIPSATEEGTEKLRERERQRQRKRRDKGIQIETDRETDMKREVDPRSQRCCAMQPVFTLSSFTPSSKFRRTVIFISFETCTELEVFCMSNLTESSLRCFNDKGLILE